jgi:undecaprenyl-diphosphatase
MDWSLTHALNAYLAAHDALEDPLVAYAAASELLVAGTLVLLFVLARGPRRTGERRIAAAAVASAGLALLAAQVLARVADRPRPFVTHPGGVHLFAAHAADPGFPSDHATAAFAIATAIVLRDRRWGAFALLLAVLLAFARVAMGVHYPSDVLAGALSDAVLRTAAGALRRA